MKRVVVVGAGAAGLSVLRCLSKRSESIYFVAYEQSDKVGGTWIINDQYKPTSMYDNLRTNLPKEVMAFPDLQFSSDIRESFVGHKEVLKYLQDYASHFNLLQYIKFRHTVTEVDPVVQKDGEIWNVTIRDDILGTESTSQYDAVIICNGHYTYPLIPEIEGSKTFTGQIIHSHYYRSPQPYKDQSVLVLGAGPSGTDIAVDLSSTCSKVYLSHNKSRLVSPLPENTTEVYGIKKISGDDIILNDDRIVKADVIMLATGYKYKFPFLTPKCQPDIENEHFKSVYRMLVDIKHPTMYFMALNKSIAPFPQFYMQAEFTTSMIVGAVKTPSMQEMQAEHDSLYKSLVTDCSRREKDFHFIKAYQWEYNNQLAALAAVEPLKQCVEKLYLHCDVKRCADLRKYKNAVYRFADDNETFITISDSV